MEKVTELPVWDMSNVFPSMDSKEFDQAFLDLESLIQELGEYIKANKIGEINEADDKDPEGLGKIIEGFLELANNALNLSHTLHSYIVSFTTTNSLDSQAAVNKSKSQKLQSELLQYVNTVFKLWIGKQNLILEEIFENNPASQSHKFYLKSLSDKSQYMMSPAEEKLAAELSLSGTKAWSNLQQKIVSQLKWQIQGKDGNFEEKPITEIINLRTNPDEKIRKRGYLAELEAWKSVEHQLAACLNGLKGGVGTLDLNRGREDALHSSLENSRIDRETIEALTSVMKDSFPMFQKYFNAKAKRIGKEKLAWWDLMAPTGNTDKTFTYQEATEFVKEHFNDFSPDLAKLAEKAFDNNWIDVGPREGKVAGAFCMGILSKQESRILLNFDGSLDSVSTLAHELGHAYHNEQLKGNTYFNQITPMTLAETASIMCETLITNATLESAESHEEELAILENDLIGSSQVVVDIYSRYLFEKEVFERRSKAELSPEEFSEIMEWAQKETYGEGLDHNYLQKYMWTWKPHYYQDSLSFYNYPYAFGLLFGTGLYAIYKERGEVFISQYRELLGSTGLANAADLAARFEIDIRSKEFWQGSIDIISNRVDRYLEI